MTSMTFDGTNFTSSYGLIVLDSFEPPARSVSNAAVVTFPGTTTRRAYRGSPQPTIVNVPVYIPTSNWASVMTSLETITMKTLTIDGNSWSAIWDGGPVEREPLRTGYIATLRFIA